MDVGTRAVEKSEMDGGKQQPQLFRADLFSSPPSGLSLGLGDEAFSSPLSLAPALGTAATGSPSSKCALNRNSAHRFRHYLCFGDLVGEASSRIKQQK